MGKILDWAKANMKDGANLAEFESLVEASTLEGVTTKEQAIEVIRKNPLLTSALDYSVTEAVKSHDAKFSTEKLPTLIEAERQKIKNELNPPKTESEKRLAEAEKTINAMKAQQAENELKTVLRSKAKEYGYPEDLAERFYIYGEGADQMMKTEADFWKGQVDSGVTSRVKELYGDVEPPKVAQADVEKIIGRTDFMNLSPTAQSEFVANGGSVVDH